MTLPSWLEPASCLINWQHDRSAAVLLPGQRTFIFLYQENLIIGILLCLSQSKERAKTKLLSLYILHVHTGYEKATRWKWESNQDSKMSSSMSGSNLAQSVAERLADQIQVFYQHAFYQVDQEYQFYLTAWYIPPSPQISNVFWFILLFFLIWTIFLHASVTLTLYVAYMSCKNQHQCFKWFGTTNPPHFQSQQ